MFSMWVVLLVFSSICTVVFSGAKKTVTGHTGERLDIKCPYESGYESSSKYFCKGECNFGKKNKVVESGSPAKDKRFSLTDDTTARVFSVTITDLRTEDAGQYWCAVEGIIFDAYTEILLIVKQVVVGAPKTVTGYRGEQLDIRCPYESGYESNAKYFCKGACNIGNKNIMVKSGSVDKDQRFSLTDNKTTRVFTVTITDLRQEDEGQYWCAVEGRVYDGYSEIMLLVKRDNKTTVSTISHFTTTRSYFNTTEPNQQSASITITERKETITDHHSSSTGSVIYVSVGLVIMLIIFLLALMVVCRKRSKKSPKVAQSGNSQPVSVVLLPLNANTAEDIDCNNHSYQEISELQCKITTIYTTADGPDDSMIYLTADQPDASTIYSTANQPNISTIYSTADIPDDSMIYSTADQPKNSTIYSTAKSPNY